MIQPSELAHKIFHAYDVRGLSPSELDLNISYLVTLAFLQVVPGDRFLIGYDMRSTTPEIVKGIAAAMQDSGKQLDSLGMTNTDMLYFGVGHHNYDGGMMVTASHNPAKYNGIKMVSRDVHPVNMYEVKQKFSELNPSMVPTNLQDRSIHLHPVNFSTEYLNKVLSFVMPQGIKPMKVIVDAGNGMMGPITRKLFSKIPQIELLDMYFEPNATFPHHEANPAIKANTSDLSREVIAQQADLGIAFDGDGDRCFFVDEKGEYVPAHLTAAILGKIFMMSHPESSIVYDYRNIMALDYEVEKENGNAFRSRSGHVFVKEVMREHGSVFGAESSGHFFFRDFYNTDSGLIPMLLMLEYLSTTDQTLSEAVAYYRTEFFSSGEHNFKLNPEVTLDQISSRLQEHFHGERLSEPDGIVMDFEGWRFNIRESNTEPLVRVNIEANSQTQLDKAILEIHEIMAEYGEYLGSNTADIGSSNSEKFNKLLQNIWYTWNPHHQLPFTDLYGSSWRKNSPPINYTSPYGQRVMTEILNTNSEEIDHSIRQFNEYLSDQDTWFDKQAKVIHRPEFRIIKEHPIAYFTMEYGLIDWLQIYSGGLGVLAGDFLKTASDMGVPVLGIGLFYHQGYFHQDIDNDGKQLETYIQQNPEEYPLQLVTDNDGAQLEVTVEIARHSVYVRAWKLKVGRTDLILLDTNFDSNQIWEDKMITAHLYGGDLDTRIRQEIVLGMAGAKMIKALKIDPSIYHMNEGHSGFLVLQLTDELVEEQKLSFRDALTKVNSELVFTNHTLKQAGNDIFDYHLIEKYFGSLATKLGVTVGELFELGKDQLYSGGKFSMTILGLRYSRFSNAVSQIHGKAAKKLWPDFNLVPITNGVHMPTWVTPQIHKLLDKYVGENWHNPVYKVDYSKVFDIPDSELWEAHMIRKHILIEVINNELSLNLDHHALTIAWARRLASYKRPDLITQDLDRLVNLVINQDRPVQILLAGKAHPKDGVGKEMLQRMYNSVKQSQAADKIQIIPGYNWQLARKMVSGADVWLNTPFKYEEASGTSGMKAGANGVLQLTTIDGWADEVDWSGKGWAISDQAPVDSLFEHLEQGIIPMYYQHGIGSFNPEWTKRMKATMKLVLERYSSIRMMEEYLENLYIPTILDSPEFDTKRSI